MPHPARLSCLLVLCALAGCTTYSGHNVTRAQTRDRGHSAVAVVPPPPLIAGPTSEMPTPMEGTGINNSAAIARSLQSARAPGPDPNPPPVRLARNPAPSKLPAHAGKATWLPLEGWCSENSTAILRRLTPAPTPTYELRSEHGVMVLRAGNLAAHWNGVEVRLGFAPFCIENQLYMHPLDLQKTVQPLMASLKPATGGVIVLDPGHGGEDTGARSADGKQGEKEFTLDLAVRIEHLLMARGFQVFLTRSNDANIPLGERVDRAASHHANLFLSLHFNSASPNQSEAGLETYCLTPAGMPSSLTRGFSDEVSDVFPNNSFDRENLCLAAQVHHALLQGGGQRDRGVRRARFPAVLRGQRCPAVLIEGGYLSNPHEAQQIADPNHRQRMAEAIVRALQGCIER